MIPKAVIFDCDGVVVDSEGIGFAMLAEQMALYGHPMSVDQMRDLFLGGTLRGFWTEARARGVPLPDDWVADHNARLAARLAAGVPLIPGILAVLDRLDAAGIPYAIGSNGPPPKMVASLGQHPGLIQRFHGHIYSAQVVGTPKPAPDVYRHAAAALGVSAAHCVVIEDSPSGVRAAVAAGMRCYGYAAEDDGAALADVGAVVFHHMDNLPGLLGLAG